MEQNIDKVLEKISLVFGTDSLDILIPADVLIDFPMYKLANINKFDLENEAIFQAKAYMLFSTLLSFVSDKYLVFEAEVKKLNAQISIEYERKILSKDKEFIEKYGERTSDKKLEKLVESDERYIQMVNSKIEYKNMVNTFSNIVDALGKRGDMLIQLISKRKREQATGVV